MKCKAFIFLDNFLFIAKFDNLFSFFPPRLVFLLSHRPVSPVNDPSVTP